MIKHLLSAKILVLGILTAIFCSNLSAQEWTWIKGSNIVGQLGIYGTQGTTSSSNLPGAREGAATWTDNSGNLWMFGGNGNCSSGYGKLNDLWKLNPSTHQWTWVNGQDAVNQNAVYGTKGVANAANLPGSRSYAVTWTDNSGNLWMFGGWGYDGSGNVNDLNDLWKYDIGANQWTWVSGTNLTLQNGSYGTLGVASTTNIPGARRHSVSWKDASGNLWLFGGYGLPASGGAENSLNDLWKYNISGGTWTWVNGTDLISQTGVYGTKGVASATTTPGTRYGATSWTDNSGSLWLFGGIGYGSTALGPLQDVWKFNTSTSQWTWVNGTGYVSLASIFGVQSVPSSSASPGGRYFGASWTDTDGNLFLQGGYGVSNNYPNSQNLNDVWKYNTTSNQWAWIRGAAYEIIGNNGTQSVTATSNDPGSGYVRASWKDNLGNFWLFGGNGYDGVGNYSILSDLWKMNYCVAPAPVSVASYSAQNPCTGRSATLSAVSNTNSVSWYSVPTGGTALGTGSTYVTSSLSSGTAATSSFTYYAQATNTCGTSLVRTPIVVTSNSIYPVVTTGPIYTVAVAIPYGFTPNSSWSPWVWNFADPVPPGGIVVGIDLTCDVVDQGWGGSGAGADMQVADQRVGYPILQHWSTTQSFTTTAPFPNYVYGGSNTFKMYFVGWGGWQGFLNSGTLIIRYQTKFPPAVNACQNSSLTLKGYGAVTYTWSGGAKDGIPQALSTSQIYTVTGANAYGCTDNATLQVNVTPAPTVAVAGSTAICLGSGITETATVNGTSHTFSWSTGSGALSISATPTISTTYVATASNTLTGCSHSVTRKVIVSPAPVVTVSASSQTICSGFTTALAVNQSSSAYGLNFDGIDDYIETNSAITEMGQADFSIEAWIKTTGYSEAILISENSNASWDPGEKAFYLDASGIPTFVGWGNSYIMGNVPVNDGSWHHVAVVWDHNYGTYGVGKIYVDGVDHTGSSPYVSLYNNIGTIKIGLQNYNGYTPEAPNNFTGSMDDIRIWNTARTSSEITANYNSCLTGNEYGLVAYYKLEDGPGHNSVTDQTVSDNHGTLVNMNTSTDWISGLANCTTNYSSYTWNPGALSSASVIVSPAATTVYTVNVTNNYGCSGPATQTITVNPSPTITVNSGAICIGKSFTLNPSGATSYVMSGGSSVVSPTVTTNYSVTGSSAQGCASTNTAVAIVTVNSLPVLSISGSSVVCNGASVTQTVSGASTYTWSTGALTANVSLTPTATTIYSVVGTNTTTGCSNSTSKLITYATSPVISVNSGNICAGTTFTMIPSGASTYTFSGATGTVLATVSPTTNSTYYVSGTSAQGCVSTGSAISNVIVNAAPVIVMNSGGVCAGSVYTLVPTGASTYTFLNGSYTVSPSSNTNYSVMGTNVLGCVSAFPGVANVTVNPIPVISVSNGTVCSGSVYTIVPGGASTYTYSGGSNMVSPLVNTNYSVTGTSAQGCVSSAPGVLTVSVVARPVISVNSSTVCSGSVFTLNPTGASTYTYSSGSSTVIPFSNSSYSVTGTSSVGCLSSNVAVSNLTVINLPLVVVNSGSVCAGKVFTFNPSGASTYSYSSNSATVSPSATTVYTVTGISAQGCSSGPVIATVIVNASPSISISGGGPLCLGQSVNLISTGATSFTWNTNATGPILSVTPSTTTSYTVNGAASNGCINTATILLTVNPLPVLSLNSGTICPAGMFTLSPSGAVTYTYSSGSNIVSPAVTTNYSVTGTDANGCVTPLAAVATVSVINTISLSVSGTTLLCAGETATFSATGAATYSWNTGGLTSTIVSTPTSNATYMVIGMDGSCSDTAYINVNVNALPQVQVNSSSSLICVGESVTLVSNGASSYVWSGGMTTATILVTPTLTSTYTVTGTDANGCVNTAVYTQTVSDCLGIQANPANWTVGFNLYPNPNDGRFTIETNGSLRVKLFNSIGQILLEEQILPGNTELDLKEHAKGIYFVELKDGKQTKTLKVIRQ